MNGIGSYVLVVDDLHDAADSMAEMLALWGHASKARYCGASALAAVRDHRPNLILLDIGMAPMDGFVFASHVRQLSGGDRTAIVAVSGHSGKTFQRRALDLGIAHYLLKPADPKLLRPLVGRLMEEAGHRRGFFENPIRKKQACHLAAGG
ncbi:response regulator [Zavarzinella formosa]|uniref:response regulator n=1 Tax=Zavarzinella formosa TaxID=360055 RepID=UPI00030437D9|nr:response regulator [Zavarzinella formosa]